MATNDTTGSKRSAGDLAPAALVCEAHDLKKILTHMADQIADADRRHSKALSMMQERLGLLGSAAQGLREHLPQEMTGVLDRIEGSMAELSDRIAEVDAQRRGSALLTPASALLYPSQPVRPVTPAFAASTPTVSATMSALADKPSIGAPPVPAPMPLQLAEAAPALRSALAADALDAYAKRAQASRNGSQTPVDNFDVVETQDSPREDDVWDHDAADALAKLYEASVVEASGTPTLDVAAASPAPAARFVMAPVAAVAQRGPVASAAVVETMHVAAPMAQPASMAPPVNAPPTTAEIASEIMAQHAQAQRSERVWLEQRFADIAKRLEESLSILQPSGTFEAIEARFSSLEEKITAAMNDAAKTSDFAGLRGIESQVEDLNAQLINAQTHFSRLDTIELELRSLADRLPAEDLARLFEQSGAAGIDNEALAGAVANRVVQQMPRMDETLKAIAERLSADRIASLVADVKSAGPDAGAIATMVAEQVSQRMPKPQPQSPPIDHTPRLEDIKTMLELFMSEQRHGDEQTTTMLDTMQQAMIRLLDRMDSIEQTRSADADGMPAVPHQDYSQPSRDMDDEVEPPTPTRHRSDTRDEAEETVYQSPAARQTPSSPGYVPEPRITTPAAPIPSPTPPPPLPSAPSGSALRASMQQGAGVAESQTTVPGTGGSREDYIASARRAARMAAEAPAEAESAEAAAETATPRAVKARAKSGEKDGSRQLSRISMSLICLLLVGASFVAVKSTILAPPGPPLPPGQSRAPGAEPASARSNAEKQLQNLEDADIVIEDDRKPRTDAPANPRRSSLQGGEDRDGLSLPGGQGSGASTVPASLTKEMAPAAPAARSNEMPPLSIGPNSLRTAAAKGDASAEFEVGARFAEGKGVPQDLLQAVNWYQRSASQGFAPAQYRLGSMFERGLGVKVDLARARIWYQRAAEQGIVKAMHNLAVLSAGRDTAVTDYQAAGKWFRTAADHGLNDSQFNLAIMYDSGLGLERDSKQAFKWFSLAARAGDDEASRRREALRQKLLPQEVAEIEAEITNWRPKAAEQSLNDPRMAGEGWKNRTR